MAGTGRYQEGAGVSCHRPVGGHRGEGADAAIHRPDREAPLRDGGARGEGFSAHGLRSGYLTEAGRQGVALPEAMQQSLHRSVQQAASYYNDVERGQGRAAGGLAEGAL